MVVAFMQDDGMKTQVNKWFYNNGFQIRVSTGAVKRRKMNPESDVNASRSAGPGLNLLCLPIGISKECGGCYDISSSTNGKCSF